VGLAFSLDIVESRRAMLLEAGARLLAATGFILSAWQLTDGPTALLDASDAVRAGLASLLALAAAWVLWPAVRRLSGRHPPTTGASPWRLRVDDAGDCSLESPDRLGLPVMLLRACILPGLILVSLAPSQDSMVEGNSVFERRFGRHWLSRTFTFGRDAMPRETWRCLNVWLVWSSRGRRDRPPGWKTQ
jgi:hypothetical protein